MPEHIFSDFLHHLPSPEKKPKQIQMGGYSQSKDKDPKNNEDEFFIDPDHRSVGVFDGVSGVPNGQSAARKCSESIKQSFSEISSFFTNSSPEGIEEIIQNITTKANLAITEGYTTGVFGVIVTDRDGKLRAYIGCVGDSRVYSVHRNVLRKETRDQNSIPYIAQDDLDKLKGKRYTRYQKTLINNNDIGQLFGEPNVFPVITKIDLEPGDTLLFLSDGISNSLVDKEISSTYRRYRHKNPEDISRGLVNRAYENSQGNNARSTPDDMTAVVVKIK